MKAVVLMVEVKKKPKRPNTVPPESEGTTPPMESTVRTLPDLLTTLRVPLPKSVVRECGIAS